MGKIFMMAATFVVGLIGEGLAKKGYDKLLKKKEGN